MWQLPWIWISSSGGRRCGSLALLFSDLHPHGCCVFRGGQCTSHSHLSSSTVKETNLFYLFNFDGEKLNPKSLQGVDGEGQRVKDDQISRLIVTPHSGEL